MPGRAQSIRKWTNIDMHNLLRPGCVCAAVLFSQVTTAENLSEIYQQALQHDPRFKAQQAALQATLENRPQAQAQLIKPEIVITANADRNFQDIELKSGFGLGGYTEFNAYGYSLDLTQPIFHYDRYLRLQQVDAEIFKAQLELDAAEQDLMIRTSESYFNVLAAKDDVEFSQAEKAALEKQLDQTSQRFEVGLIAITDVQEARAGYDLAIARELQAINQLDDAKEALKEITGTYPQSLSRLSANLITSRPDPEDIQSWTQSALQNNFGLKARLIDAEIAEKEISRQASGHLPAVDLVGSHGFRSSGGQFGNSELEFSAIGVQARIPIYEGGQVTSRTRAALQRHEEALHRLEQSRRAVERTSREAFLGILSGISLIKAFKQAVTSSETAVIATNTGYEAGTRTAVDVVTAEQELFRAKKDYSRAKYQYILDNLRLKQASGKLAPEDIYRINTLLK